MTNYKFIEVCAGCGGLSTGFINAGFQASLLNDNDKNCVQTLQLNHPGTVTKHCSIEDLKLEDCEKNIDLLMGGVPCQSFSQAGKRKGIEDKRGKLVYTFIKMVNYIQPKVFLIENVKGLVSHNNGETLKHILHELEKSGRYNIQYKVLNANDFNVPQNRERLIIVGVHKLIGKTFQFPQKDSRKPNLRSVLENCPSSSGTEYNDGKRILFEMIPEGGCWVNLPIELQKSYMGNSYKSGGGKRGILKRLSMDKPCLTLLTTPTQKQTERCHPIHTRPLQILEYARIETFTDECKFHGSVSQIYKQIGNAVPVNLAHAIAIEIKNVLC